MHSIIQPEYVLFGTPGDLFPLAPEGTHVSLHDTVPLFVLTLTLPALDIASSGWPSLCPEWVSDASSGPSVCLSAKSASGREFCSCSAMRPCLAAQHLTQSQGSVTTYGLTGSITESVDELRTEDGSQRISNWLSFPRDLKMLWHGFCGSVHPGHDGFLPSRCDLLCFSDLRGIPVKK